MYGGKEIFDVCYFQTKVRNGENLHAHAEDRVVHEIVSQLWGERAVHLHQLEIVLDEWHRKKFFEVGDREDKSAAKLLLNLKSVESCLIYF